LIATFPTSKSEVVDRIFEAGVVGAGGAGFPTHVKAGATADTVIANACECEPLLRTDRFVLANRLEDVIEGLRLMMVATGASRGLIGIRERQAWDGLRQLVAEERSIDMIEVPDTYPAGDEHILVYEATGRVVPQGAIPPEVGVVVSNVNTLFNVKEAMAGKPVTGRVLSICGDVPNPCVTEAPIGTSVGDLLELTANRIDLEHKAVLVSGVMMGELCEDLERPIDKRTSAIVVLPRSNRVVMTKALPVETMVRRAASVCCQCQFCTEMCPRHLMGHAISPHRIMRAVAWMTQLKDDLAGALLCSGCGLCGVYVCPMGLSPDRISAMVRSELARRGIRVEATPTQARPLRAARLVPHERILSRTGVGQYERDLDFVSIAKPGRVRIPLHQHAGKPAVARVKVGDRVSAGSLIAEPEEGKLGARVHASIDGKVTAVDDAITIEAE